MNKEEQDLLESNSLWYIANVLLEEELYDRATEKTKGMTLTNNAEDSWVEEKRNQGEELE